MLTRSTGFSQLELIIVLGILAILVAMAVPSFQSTLERNAVIAAAEAMSNDLRWARSEAIKRGVQATVVFYPSVSSDWEYDISIPSPAGMPDSVMQKSVNSKQEYSKVKMLKNFRADNVVVFMPARGVLKGNVNPGGTAELVSASNTYMLRVILNELGRVYICSVPAKMGGYEKC